MRARTLCFTSWDPLQLDPTVWVGCTYAVWQLECAPDTGRLHWQGYAEFDKAMRYSTLHTYDGFANPPAHFEPRAGTQAQAIAYCSKEDSRVEGPWTFGEPKQQGQRTDLEAMRADIDRGHSLKQVSKDHFPVWIKYPSAVKTYQALQAPDRTDVPSVLVILGTTGCGKSRLARALFPNAYWKPNFDYWENYQYEEVVVLDEFYGHKMQYTDLLQLLDSTPLLVNVKGASAKMVSTTIVFTSNQHPRYWYSAETLQKHCGGGYDESPLKRRLDEFAAIRYLTPVPNGVTLVLPSSGINPAIRRQPHSVINSNI
nr:MAG: replication associated protein [Cressdnaviricota sp.]